MSASLRSISFVLACGALAATASAGGPQGSGRTLVPSAGSAKAAYAPSFTHRGPLADFVQASWTTRTAAVGQNDPFLIDVPALPPGAIEVASFASWHYLDDGNSPGADTIHLNGVAVVGDWKGYMTPALCTANLYIDELSADVTGLLVFGVPNLLNDVCDKPYAGDPAAKGGGITILTVYEYPLGPDREVDLFRLDVNTVNGVGGNVASTLQLTSAYTFNDVHFFVNALGGRPGQSDAFKINGHGTAGVLPGTSAPGDAWVGLLGPNPDDNFYDAGDGEISGWMTAGDTTILLDTNTGTDCIAQTLAAVSQQVECGDVASYCTSKVNSLGCSPFVTTTGNPSVSSGLPFRIKGFDFRNNKSGLMFYGFKPAALPFQGGYLCIGGQVARTPLQNAGGNVGTNDCSGVMTYDFNALIRLGTDPGLVAGAFVYAQYWARDPANVFGTSISDAVAFDICP